MKKSSFQFATLIILLSIFTVAVQFTVWYFFQASLLSFGIGLLISLMFSHIFLRQSLTYESCFSYTLLNVLICSIVILLSFLGEHTSYLTFQSELLYIPALHLFVPFFYAILQNLFDKGHRYNGFHSFFRSTSITFLIFYAATFVFLSFITNKAALLIFTDIKSINFIPFFTLATLIEAYIDKKAELTDIGTYLVHTSCIFIPYGFYAVLLLRKSSRFIRCLALLFLPVLTEILQRIFLVGKADIDDILFGLLGGFLGGILYHLLNTAYNYVADEDFLSRRNQYSFYRNNLHY